MEKTFRTKWRAKPSGGLKCIGYLRSRSTIPAVLLAIGESNQDVAGLPVEYHFWGVPP
jgi:hypothetical protein